jgi:hypothetical protein
MSYHVNNTAIGSLQQELNERDDELKSLRGDHDKKRSMSFVPTQTDNVNNDNANGPIHNDNGDGHINDNDNDDDDLSGLSSIRYEQARQHAERQDALFSSLSAQLEEQRRPVVMRSGSTPSCHSDTSGTRCSTPLNLTDLTTGDSPQCSQPTFGLNSTNVTTVVALPSNNDAPTITT